MLMLKSLFLVLLLMIASGVYSQELKSNLPEIKASMGSYVSSGEDLPFWMTSNQNGIFTFHHSSYQLIQLGFERPLAKDSLKNWDLFYGTNLVYGFSGKTSDFQFNQYWIGTRYKWLILKAGAKPEPVLYNGLSSTNGNMDWSNNSRSVPGISLSTNGYIPFFFAKKWFSFKALYAENLLNDRRFVDNPHLHRKSLIGRASFGSINLSMGLDHWVYWGGTSPVYGKLPGFDNYFRYIVALKGGANSPNNERNNASGNSLGIYLFTFEKDFHNSKLTFYYNHPFEDRSGLEMDNAPDGLWGLHFGLKRKNILSDFVYEFQNTTNQSGTYNMVEVGNTGRFTGRGNDNYFNNWIYKSGHVYYNHMMGSPVFVPVIDANGISKGFDNTRILLHHIGLSGWLNERLTWRSLISFSRSFGTYDPEGVRYDPPLDQLSFLTECGFIFKNLPLRFNAGVAGDYGNRFEKRMGAYAGLSWTWK